MDAQDYFKLHEKKLLEVIRTQTGRDLLGIKNTLPIVKISPNSYHQLLGFDNDKPVFQATFFTSNRTVEKLFPLLWQADAFLYSSSYHPKAYFDQLTFNPAAGEKSGFVSAELSWAAARDAASSETNGTACTCESFVSTTYYNYRCFEPFLTSSLTDRAQVISSNFKGYRDDSLEIGGNGFDNADTTSVEVVVSTQTDPTAYANDDYNNITFASKGSLAFASTTDVTVFTITITDQTIISTTSYTKLCIITGLDLNNTTPNGENRLTWQNKGQANPPILTVVYTLSGGSKMLLGLG